MVKKIMSILLSFSFLWSVHQAALAEVKQIGPHAWEYSIDQSTDTGNGIQVLSADAVQTIGSKSVGDTISTSISLCLTEDTLPLDYVSGWAVYVNGEYLTQAEIWSKMESIRIVNYTSTVAFSGDIESICCIAQIGADKQESIFLMIYGEPMTENDLLLLMEKRNFDSPMDIGQ